VTGDPTPVPAGPDLAELRRLAEAAVGWEDDELWCESPCVSGRVGAELPEWACDACRAGWHVTRLRDLAGPGTLLALLDRIEALEAADRSGKAVEELLLAAQRRLAAEVPGLDDVLCPSCLTPCDVETHTEDGDTWTCAVCPVCAYEIGADGATVRQMLEGDDGEPEWDDVNLPAWTRKVAALLGALPGAAGPAGDPETGEGA
jgi:hypothetical protein